MVESIWDKRGDIGYETLTVLQKQELDDFLADTKALYAVYRPIQLKYIIEKILECKTALRPQRLYDRHGRASGTVKVAKSLNEWDLKNASIIGNALLEDSDCTMEKVHELYVDQKEQIEIALNYISGIFKHAKIWKGHIDLLRNYNKQLRTGIPLSERQADTLFKLLHRYSKQVVANQIL